MATKISKKIKQNTTYDDVKEVISVTGSIISGSYPEPGVAGTNILNDTEGMYQTTHDFPHLSQSSIPAFDITFGARS